MLVLTRKLGEAIQIADDVTIEVLEVRGGRVRLGITAPSDVRVHRAELVLSKCHDERRSNLELELVPSAH